MKRSFIVLFGGTFDPIHLGHVEGARAVAARSGCDELVLLPSAVPPHREAPCASPAERLEMARLAAADMPRVRVDARELERGGPSFTVDTLASFRAELGMAGALALVVGADTLGQLDDWNRSEQLDELAHLIVLDRPGSVPASEGPVVERYAARARADPGDLRTAPAGLLWWARQRPRAVSASNVRRRLRRGESANHLLPPAVSAYIQRVGLYRGGTGSGF